MVTQSIAIDQIRSLILQLKAVGYEPTQAFLFGSVAKGMQYRYSDIDLALWDERFTGCLTIDYEPIKRILTQFPLIELHTFASDDDEHSNPFIAEIRQNGIPIHLPKPQKQ
jgi:predicted nucleotidyltransferase